MTLITSSAKLGCDRCMAEIEERPRGPDSISTAGWVVIAIGEPTFKDSPECARRIASHHLCATCKLDFDRFMSGERGR